MLTNKDASTEVDRNMNDSRDQTTTTPTKDSKFPAKLHFMLNDLKEDSLECIASWQQHGRCFIVRKPKEFESTILPCYFQQSKLTSFQRQLSFYGFRRINYGRDKGGYYHEYFLRGKEELTLMIKRTKVKGTGPRKPNSMEAPAPNFYEMPFLDENTKNSITHNSVEKKQPDSSSKQTGKHDTTHNEYASPISSTQSVQVTIPREIATSFAYRREDDDDVLLKRNHQKRLNQLYLLKELERDQLLLSRSNLDTIKIYIQERASCQAIFSNLQHVGRNELDCLRGLGISSSHVSCDNYPMSKGSSTIQSQSLLGLSYRPFVASSSSSYFPSSSCNVRSALPISISGGVTQSSTYSSDVIRLALANYFQEMATGKLFG